MHDYFDFLQHRAWLLLPLLSAILYAFGTLALKASSDRGTNRGSTTFLCNFALAVGFLIFYDWGSFPTLPTPVWPVLLLGLLFVSGQIFTILALSSGEVSSVTPVFGEIGRAHV